MANKTRPWLADRIDSRLLKKYPSRGSSTKPMKSSTRERLAHRSGGKVVADPTTGTLRYHNDKI